MSTIMCCIAIIYLISYKGEESVLIPILSSILSGAVLIMLIVVSVKYRNHSKASLLYLGADILIPISGVMLGLSLLEKTKTEEYDISSNKNKRTTFIMALLAFMVTICAGVKVVFGNLAWSSIARIYSTGKEETVMKNASIHQSYVLTSPAHESLSIHKGGANGYPNVRRLPEEYIALPTTPHGMPNGLPHSIPHGIPHGMF